MDNEPILNMAHIAERAGMSERTLFRYFGNQDGLFRVVGSSLVPMTLPYLTEAPPKGSFESRVRALVQLRCTFAREFAAMGRTVDRFMNQFEAARALRDNRDALARKQLRSWLGPELKKLDKKTLVVVQQMLDFSFLDAMNNAFDSRAAQVLGDHVMVILRSGLTKRRESKS